MTEWHDKGAFNDRTLQNLQNKHNLLFVFVLYFYFILKRTYLQSILQIVQYVNFLNNLENDNYTDTCLRKLLILSTFGFGYSIIFSYHFLFIYFFFSRLEYLIADFV